jgi:hypothetical protein
VSARRRRKLTRTSLLVKAWLVWALLRGAGQCSGSVMPWWTRSRFDSKRATPARCGGVAPRSGGPPAPGRPRSTGCSGAWKRPASKERRACSAWLSPDQRVQAVCDLIVGQAAKGDPFFQQHLAEGHLDGYQRDLVYIESLREPLQEALEAGR